MQSAPGWYEESCGVGSEVKDEEMAREERERRRSSRIKRREPGCEPGWRGCSAGT